MLVSRYKTSYFEGLPAPFRGGSHSTKRASPSSVGCLISKSLLQTSSCAPPRLGSSFTTTDTTMPPQTGNSIQTHTLNLFDRPFKPLRSGAHHMVCVRRESATLPLYAENNTQDITTVFCRLGPHTNISACVRPEERSFQTADTLECSNGKQL